MKRLTERLAPLWHTLQAWGAWVLLMTLGGLLLVLKPIRRAFTALGRAVTSRPGAWVGRTASTGVIAYSWYSLTRSNDLADLDGTPAFRYGILYMLTMVWAFAVFEAVRNRLRRKTEALPVDPSFPPTKLVYLQGDGEPERCACHGRPIEDGAEIWHWPQPAKLVCIKKSETAK